MHLEPMLQTTLSPFDSRIEKIFGKSRKDASEKREAYRAGPLSLLPDVVSSIATLEKVKLTTFSLQAFQFELSTLFYLERL